VRVQEGRRCNYCSQQMQPDSHTPEIQAKAMLERAAKKGDPKLREDITHQILAVSTHPHLIRTSTCDCFSGISDPICLVIRCILGDLRLWVGDSSSSCLVRPPPNYCTTGGSSHVLKQACINFRCKSDRRSPKNNLSSILAAIGSIPVLG